MGGKVKKSTKKFVKNKLQGAIKKRREKQHRMPKAIPNAAKAADKRAKQPLPPALQPQGEEGLEPEEEEGGDFEQYMAKELADFELDEDDEEDEEENPEGEGEGEEEEGGARQHLAELQQLRQTDPEFFAFLEKNDPSLLRFGEEQEGDEDEGEGEERALPAWLGQTSKKSVARGCREFELVCRKLGGSGQENEEGERNEENDEVIVRWGLGPGLRLAARCGTRVQRKIFVAVALLLGQAAGGWRALALEALGEAPAWSSADGQGVRAAGSALLRLWSGAEDDGERAACFLAIRTGVLSVPHPHGSRLVRAAHAHLAGSQRVSGGNLPRLASMVECVAELHGLLQPELQHSLLYSALRQHALALRSAKGFSWALLLSLRCSALAISRASSLRALVYPAVHVISGFLQISNSPIWIPAQLLLCDLLLLFSSAAYVPVAASAIRLLTALLSASAGASGASGTRSAPTLPETALRVPKAALAARGPVRETLVSRLLGIVIRSGLAVSRHASFPEWSAPISRQLRYLTRYAGHRPARMLTSLAAALDANTRHVLALRSKLQLTPHSALGSAIVGETNAPVPLETYVAKLPQQPEDFLDRVLHEAELQGLDTAEGEGQEEEGMEMEGEEEEEGEDMQMEDNDEDDDSSSE